jgi:pSer/pThr/pTyr-binding forkhead associated (FHA) protein
VKRKLVVNDGRSEREVLLVGPIVIGRDPSCHISDLDPLLSRRHAEFVPRPTGLLVRDLGSRNGILVNGSKVPERLLTSGDVVQLGHLQLRYVEEEITELHDLRHADETEPHESATMLTPAREPADVPTAVVRRLQASGPTDFDTTSPGRVSPVDTTRMAGPTAEPPGAATSTASTTRPGGFDPDILGDSPDEDTHIPRRRDDDDETRAPHSSSLARAASPDEAQLVVDANLTVLSTSSTGQLIFGVRPETLVGGSLAVAIERSVKVLATAKGRPTLALFATRNESDKTFKMTFRAGQAVEPVR